MPGKEPVDIFDLTDLCTPWCVHVAVTLRIADHLAAGTAGIGELAAAASCDRDSLQRVLRHLVSKGVFEEPSPGRFGLNETSRALVGPSAWLGLDLEGIGGRMANVWSSLLTAVQTGAPAYHTVFGRAFWADLQAHPAVSASFDALMGPPGHGTPDAGIQITGGWESIRSVVDVGGGTGALLSEILRAHSNVRGTLVDLPSTVARSRAILEAAGVTDRVTVTGQSFFEPLPPGGDLYLLKSILSDWPDREAIAILRRCAEAARPGGRVLALSGVFPDGAAGPPPEVLMMVLVGGKNRTLAEFRTLAQASGLEVAATPTQPSGRFVVECRPTDLV